MSFVAMYFTYFESFIVYKALIGHVMSERLITVPFERSEAFHLLRLMGVWMPSLHIESTNSMIMYTYQVLKAPSRTSVYRVQWNKNSNSPSYSTYRGTELTYRTVSIIQ